MFIILNKCSIKHNSNSDTPLNTFVPIPAQRRRGVGTPSSIAFTLQVHTHREETDLPVQRCRVGSEAF